jgi:hypothetical protein
MSGDMKWLWDQGTEEENRLITESLANASRDDLITLFSRVTDDFPEESADEMLLLMGRGDEVPTEKGTQ